MKGRFDPLHGVQRKNQLDLQKLQQLMPSKLQPMISNLEDRHNKAIGVLPHSNPKRNTPGHQFHLEKHNSMPSNQPQQ